MLQKIREHWLFAIARGVLAIVFGAFVLARPATAVVALVVVFGLYAFVDGIAALLYAVSPRTLYRWAPALEGVAGMVIGFLVIRSPTMPAASLYALISFWAIFVGAAQVIHAIQLRKATQQGRYLSIGGCLQVLLGILLLVRPHVVSSAMLYLIAAYALVRGVVDIVLALRMRHGGRTIPTTGGPVVQH